MACRRSSEGATSLRRTATTTSRSSPTWRPTWPQTDPTSCGWRTAPTSPLRPARCTAPRVWMPCHGGLGRVYRDWAADAHDAQVDRAVEGFVVARIGQFQKPLARQYSFRIG